MEPLKCVGCSLLLSLLLSFIFCGFSFAQQPDLTIYQFTFDDDHADRHNVHRGDTVPFKFRLQNKGDADAGALRQILIEDPSELDKLSLEVPGFTHRSRINPSIRFVTGAEAQLPDRTKKFPPPVKA